MEEYRTLLEIVNELLERGYTIDFNLMENLNLFQNGYWTNVSAEDFEIDEVHIAEDETDASGLLLVFAISSRKHHVKGIVLNALTNGRSSSVIETIRKSFRFVFRRKR